MKTGRNALSDPPHRLTDRSCARRTFGRALVWVSSLGGWMARTADVTTNQVLTPIVTPDVGISLLRVLGGLIFVLALFFAGIWLSRNWQRFVVRSGIAPRLSVLESKMIGNRQVLYVIAYRNQRMLLGSSPTGLTLISHLPEDEPSVASPPSGFAQNLRDAMTKPT